MSAPLVSIMVPVHNRRARLADYLKSALAQICRHPEVVVVDNASTDGTWNVCREFARADSRVRMFRNPENLGRVRNWQRCFREAAGPFGTLYFPTMCFRPITSKEPPRVVRHTSAGISRRLPVNPGCIEDQFLPEGLESSTK